MTTASRGGARSGIISGLLVLSYAASIQAQATGFEGEPQNGIWTCYVRTSAVDDSGLGTMRDPFKTLNWALQKGWVALHSPASSVEVVRIKVIYSSDPIAPFGFGGFESINGGWLTDDEVAAGCVRQPFPIRMIDGVDIIGVEVGEQKPVISIVHDVSFPYQVWTPSGSPCSQEEIQAAVLAASNCRLDGFVIDGREVNSYYTRNHGLYVGEAVGFEVAHCEIRGWHDQVCLDPGGAGKSLLADFSHCTFADAMPINLTVGPPLGEDHGHSNVWIRGPGDSTVAFTNCDFTNGHDALEIASIAGSTMTCTVTDCDIFDNENGFEVVGDGIVDLFVYDSRFTRNQNIIPDGTPWLVGPVAAVAIRGDGFFRNIVFRRCSFRDNTIAFLWQTRWHPSFPTALDLGRDGDDPGENSFCLDPAVLCALDDPFTICIVQRNLPGNPTPGPIYAVGNYWLPFNQSSSGADGRLLEGVIVGVPTGNFPPPAGLGEPPHGAGCDDGAAVWDRQYSALHTSAMISFDPVGFDPDYDPPPLPCFTCFPCN